MGIGVCIGDGVGTGVVIGVSARSSGSWYNSGVISRINGGVEFTRIRRGGGVGGVRGLGERSTGDSCLTGGSSFLGDFCLIGVACRIGDLRFSGVEGLVGVFSLTGDFGLTGVSCRAVDSSLIGDFSRTGEATFLGDSTERLLSGGFLAGGAGGGCKKNHCVSHSLFQIMTSLTCSTCEEDTGGGGGGCCGTLPDENP